MNINERPIIVGAHEQWINDLAFSPDGALLASGSGDSTVAVWRVDSREQLFRLDDHTYGVTRVAFSPDGQLLVTGAGDGYLMVWDIMTGKKLANLGSGGKGVTSLSVCPTPQLLCVGREGGTIEVYHGLTGKDSIETLMIAANVGVKIVLSPDGNTLAASDLYNSVTVWDVAALRNGPRTRFDLDHPFSLAFTADSRYLAVGGGGGTQIWDVARGQYVADLPCGEEYIVFSLAYDATHQWLISGRGEDHEHLGAVDVWDTATSDLIVTLSLDSIDSFSTVYAVAVNHNGSIIASGGDDNNIYLWGVGP